VLVLIFCDGFPFRWIAIADSCHLFFEDWNCNYGSNALGERRAWRECVERYKTFFQ